MEFSFAHSMIDCSSLSSTIREFHAKMPIDTCTPYVHVTSHISSSINKSQSKALPTCNIRLTTTTQLSCPLCSSRSIASYNHTQPPFPPTHSLTLSIPRNPLQERRKKNRISSAKDLAEAPRLSSSSFLPLFVAFYGPFLGLWMRMKEVSNNSFTRSAAAFTLAQTDTRDRGGVNYKKRANGK